MRHETTHELELTPGVPALFTVGTREELSIHLRQANGIVSLASFDTTEPLARLSMYTTQSMNHTWRLTSGHVIMDTECRPAWTIVRDADGALYAGGGYCGRLLDVPRHGPHDTTASCASVFAAHLAQLGYNERHLGPDTYLTAFVRPEYAANGRWNVTPSGTAGDVLTLAAAYPQQVAVLVCPHHALSPDETAGPAATISTGQSMTPAAGSSA